MLALVAAADIARAADDAPAAAAANARGQRTSTEQRWSVVAMHKDGRSNRHIARKLGVTRDTVRDILARYDATGSPLSGSRTGRPRCTDEATDTAIAFTAHVDVFTSPRQIRRKLEFGDALSISTIDRRLQEAGLFGRVARHKRDYSPEELRKRLSFAEGYQDWTEAQWCKVLFSDEKCFYGEGFCGRTWVRRPKGEALNPKYCVHKKAHPVKVNVWACFCADGQGYMHIFNENMDGALMKRILSDNLLPSAQLHFSFDPPEPWYLLHDNDKKFGCAAVKELLHEKGVTTIDFPPYSPDLNPIENLWAAVARAVERHACETLEQLQDVVAAEWDKVNKDLMRSLARSMPARCQAVIAARGWHTKY
jgi:transposase